MHIKRIHEMEEKLTEIALCEINKGIECVNTAEMGAVIDMIKDLACAEKEAREAKEMEKEEEEEKKENEYFLKMLKEEYGDEEGEKRFYSGQPRSRTSGRFMRRGDGRRRGYEEPPYYHMTPEMMREHDPEYWRDMDREMGRMYYGGGSGGSSSGGSGGQSGGSGMSGGNIGGNSGGSTRGYEDGFGEGQRRGYEDGYRDGESRGRSQGGNRDRREGRSGQMRRSYMETKEMNKGNTPQEKQEKMKELEKYMGELGSDITEMISDASNEEKTMLKSKLQTLVQKIQ